ncbi:hypothetical protein MHTCC0001_14400 [Flavobacteriaceae bacterium MHTCC 0001]
MVTAQTVTPIQTVSGTGFNFYKASAYDDLLQEIESTSYEDKEKISNTRTRAVYKSDSGFNDNFFQTVLSPSNYNTLKNNRSRQTLFKVSYVIDNTGNTTYSAALRFPTSLVTLSNAEVEAILTEALNHKFAYTKKPSDVNCFFLVVTYSFII